MSLTLVPAPRTSDIPFDQEDHDYLCTPATTEYRIVTTERYDATTNTSTFGPTVMVRHGNDWCDLSRRDNLRAVDMPYTRKRGYSPRRAARNAAL